MSAEAFVKWFPSDFLQGVADLDYPAIAVYTIVINLIYDNDGDIVDDVGRIARRCGMRRPLCEATLERLVGLGKIFRAGGFISNKRAEKEIVTRRERMTKARASAQSRWSKENGKVSQNNGGGMLPHAPSICETDAIPEARVQKPEKKEDGAEAPLLFAPPPEPPDARVYRRGREVLGKDKWVGALVRDLIKAKGGNFPLVVSAIETASTKDDAKAYLFGVVNAAKREKRALLEGSDLYSRPLM